VTRVAEYYPRFLDTTPQCGTWPRDPGPGAEVCRARLLPARGAPASPGTGSGHRARRDDSPGSGGAPPAAGRGSIYGGAVASLLRAGNAGGGYQRGAGDTTRVSAWKGGKRKSGKAVGKQQGKPGTDRAGGDRRASVPRRGTRRGPSIRHHGAGRAGLHGEGGEVRGVPGTVGLSDGKEIGDCRLLIADRKACCRSSRHRSIRNRQSAIGRSPVFVKHVTLSASATSQDAAILGSLALLGGVFHRIPDELADCDCRFLIDLMWELRQQAFRSAISNRQSPISFPSDRPPYRALPHLATLAVQTSAPTP